MELLLLNLLIIHRFNSFSISINESQSTICAKHNNNNISYLIGIFINKTNEHYNYDFTFNINNESSIKLFEINFTFLMENLTDTFKKIGEYKNG